MCFWVQMLLEAGWLAAKSPTTVGCVLLGSPWEGLSFLARRTGEIRGSVGACLLQPPPQMYLECASKEKSSASYKQHWTGKPKYYIGIGTNCSPAPDHKQDRRELSTDTQEKGQACVMITKTHCPSGKDKSVLRPILACQDVSRIPLDLVPAGKYPLSHCA